MEQHAVTDSLPCSLSGGTMPLPFTAELFPVPRRFILICTQQPELTSKICDCPGKNGMDGHPTNIYTFTNQSY